MTKSILKIVIIVLDNISKLNGWKALIQIISYLFAILNVLL